MRLGRAVFIPGNPAFRRIADAGPLEVTILHNRTFLRGRDRRFSWPAYWHVICSVNGQRFEQHWSALVSLSAQIRRL